MKRILTAKDGVTLLEGVIALGLLALIAGGAFAVLLASSRQTTQPDIREETILAVERMNGLLKSYTGYMDADLREQSKGYLVESLNPSTSGTLGNDFHVTSWSNLDSLVGNTYEISQSSRQLPPICDGNKSKVEYTIKNVNHDVPFQLRGEGGETLRTVNYAIQYKVTCNGYQL